MKNQSAAEKQITLNLFDQPKLPTVIHQNRNNQEKS